MHNYSSSQFQRDAEVSQIQHAFLEYATGNSDIQRKYLLL